MRLFFQRFKNMMREVNWLIRKEKAWFLAPLFISLILIGLLVYQAGPAVIIAFIYAGV